MLSVHPISRLASALLIISAIFLAKTMATLITVYVFVFLTVLAARVTSSHLRFVVIVSTPLLLSLLVVWGWVIVPHQIPLPHKSGVSYAFFLWLRIVAWGGVLQFLFVPLVEKPSHLTDFLDRTGLGGLMGMLIIASIIFLPELRRRLGQILDARNAQGTLLRGLKGLREVPGLLMPLISSLLDSAVKRAELWSHRGILVKGRGASREIAYNGLMSIFLFLFALSSCMMVFMA
jgi:energy-coupling factor transporter transmembrane protein EcfT